MSQLDDDREEYIINSLRVLERTRELIKIPTEDIVHDIKLVIETEEGKFILEEDIELINSVLDYYEENKVMSNLRKYFLCKALAEQEQYE